MRCYAYIPSLDLREKSICASAENFDISISAAPAKLAQLTLTGISISHSWQRSSKGSCEIAIFIWLRRHDIVTVVNASKSYWIIFTESNAPNKNWDFGGCHPGLAPSREILFRWRQYTDWGVWCPASRSSPRPRDAQFLASVSGIPAPAAWTRLLWGFWSSCCPPAQPVYAKSMDKEIKSPVKHPQSGLTGVILVAFFNKLVVEQGCYRQRPSCESFLLFF